MAPVTYLAEELADMVFVYGLANGNSLLASRLYEDRYPNRQLPHHQMFARVYQRLRETGSVTMKKRRERANVRPVELEEAVLNRIEEDPTTSIRRIAVMTNASKSIVGRILAEQSLHPFHYQKVQALVEGDNENRETFCRWALLQEAEAAYFPANVLFTDEATFTRSGIFNFHNAHIWSVENPHAVVETSHQRRFSINVWAGVVRDQLVGPVFLPNRLTGNEYLQVLRNNVEEVFDDMPLQHRRNAYFIHDGAPAHFSIQVREYLNARFGNNWIGRGGPVLWPPRSPDLNPLDFCIWGYLKLLVYLEPIVDVDHLRNKIENSFNHVRQDPGIFERIRNSFKRRIRACVQANGEHIEHLL